MAVDSSEDGIISVEEFIANGDINSKHFIGIAVENILPGEVNKSLVYGILDNFDTTAFNVLDENDEIIGNKVLWADPDDDGELTIYEPSYPQLILPCAQVLEYGTNGSLMVSANVGIELSDVQNINLSTVRDGHVLMYDSDNGLWTNKNILSGLEKLGITLDNVGNLTTPGLINGRDLAVDGAKLDNINITNIENSIQEASDNSIAMAIALG
jgi:hypothetical protein